MTSIKVHLNKYRSTKSGTYPLVFQILHRRKKRVIYSPYRLPERSFDEQKGVAVNRRNKKALPIHEVNDYISETLHELQQVIDMLELQDKNFSVSEIVELFKSNQDNSFLLTYMHKLILTLKQEGRNGTANAYQSTLNCMLRFIGNDECLSFGEINVRWLNRFVSHLQKSGLKTNTVTFYLRILRAVYNKAYKEGVAGASYISPFKSLTISSAKTAKRAINKDTIQQMSEIKIENNYRLELSRNLFLFSYFSRGMPFVDMAFLKNTDICNDVIYYCRAKTGQPLRIKIVEPLRQIIKKYNNEGEYVLPILSSGSKSMYIQYRSSLKRYNRSLKELSDSLKLQVPLTSYVARHSWATIAKRSGIPVSVISEALGHSSEKTTYTYLAALDPSVIDAANDSISDFYLPLRKGQKPDPNGCKIYK